VKPHFDSSLDRFTRDYLNRTARHLDLTVPCVPCGVDDYAQELQWNLLKRRPRFDPDRGRWTTFVRIVTNHRAAEISSRCLRGACQARKASAVDPTDLVIEDEAASQSETRSSLQLDLSEFLKTLGPNEQTVCRALMQNSISAASRELQIPRSTLHEEITRLRQRFENAGLQKYVTRPIHSRQFRHQDR
jgi:DNA-directed RNA polymerase specialized sigma24 family protein